MHLMEGVRGILGIDAIEVFNYSIENSRGRPPTSLLSSGFTYVPSPPTLRPSRSHQFICIDTTILFRTILTHLNITIEMCLTYIYTHRLCGHTYSVKKRQSFACWFTGSHKRPLRLVRTKTRCDRCARNPREIPVIKEKTEVRQRPIRWSEVSWSINGNSGAGLSTRFRRGLQSLNLDSRQGWHPNLILIPVYWCIARFGSRLV